VTWGQEALKAFNKRIEKEVSPIASENSRPTEIEPGLKAPTSNPGAKLMELETIWHQLMFGDGHTGLSKVAKSSTDWKAEFSRFLNLIEDLKDGDIPDGQDVMWQKARLFGSAITAASEGEQAHQAIDRYLQLLGTSNVPSESVWEWYASVRTG
jgi:hypothetical protein